MNSEVERPRHFCFSVAFVSLVVIPKGDLLLSLSLPLPSPFSHTTQNPVISTKVETSIRLCSHLLRQKSHPFRPKHEHSEGSEATRCLQPRRRPQPVPGQVDAVKRASIPGIEDKENSDFSGIKIAPTSSQGVHHCVPGAVMSKTSIYNDRVQSQSNSQQDSISPDDIDHRGFLRCMAWAGTGLVWSFAGGISVARRSRLSRPRQRYRISRPKTRRGRCHHPISQSSLGQIE